MDSVRELLTAVRALYVYVRIHQGYLNGYGCNCLLQGHGHIYLDEEALPKLFT